MANKRSEIKKKQIETIENNISLIETLFYIFKGQVLEMDLREFCVKCEIYQNEEQCKTVIKKLINNNIVKIKKLVNTDNNVVVAKAPVYNYFGLEGKTTKYSIETVTRNSYVSKIIMNLEKIQKHDIKRLAKMLEENTTLLSSKRKVDTCYKPFVGKLTQVGIYCQEDAYLKEEGRKLKLKNIEKVELKPRDTIYTETLQTLRERDIYVISTGGRYKVIIIDNNSDYILSTLAKKIGLVLRVFAEQVKEQEDMQIFVYLKSKASKERLQNNFITRYKEGLKVNLDEAINKELKGGYYLNYQLKTSRNGVYLLENIYANEMMKTLKIQLIETDIAQRHNSDLKTKGLIEHKKQLKEKSTREQVLAELRAKGLLIERSTELDDI